MPVVDLHQKKIIRIKCSCQEESMKTDNNQIEIWIQIWIQILGTLLATSKTRSLGPVSFQIDFFFEFSIFTFIA